MLETEKKGGFAAESWELYRKEKATRAAAQAAAAAKMKRKVRREGSTLLAVMAVDKAGLW